MKIALKSLGCAKNQVDAEYLLGELVEAGHILTEAFNEAECIIVNTCGFIESAKEESLNEIFSLLENKIKGKCKYFIVTGCLAQRYVDELAKEIPEVDAVLGVGSIKEVKELLGKVEPGKTSIKKEGYFLNSSQMPRHSINGAHSIYIKIADGCDNRCTYCAIPGIRGPYRSRTVEDILDEARFRIADGVKELNIIAQDTTSYGRDIYKTKKIADLLAQLAQLDGDYWVRILYSYPELIDDKLLNVIASSQKVCKYIDMPIQHVHPEIVKKMNRKLDAEALLKLINKIRSLIPDIAIRSTFLVGFPGEKAEHFNYLKDFIQEAQLDWAGVFAYSREENTPAYNLPGQVVTKTKIYREQKLNILQQEISATRIQRFVGKPIRVLVEGESQIYSGMYEGRSMYQAPDVDGLIYFTSTEQVKLGEFTTITVTHTDGLDVIGENKA